VSTTSEDTGAVPERRTIDVTAAGATIYEQMILSQARAPARGIADMETRRAVGSHPSEREMRAMQLDMEASQIEAAMSVLRRIAARYGLPPATIMRDGASGMRMAARRLADVAYEVA
jgi:hypothetical protein